MAMESSDRVVGLMMSLLLPSLIHILDLKTALTKWTDDSADPALLDLV